MWKNLGRLFGLGSGQQASDHGAELSDENLDEVISEARFLRYVLHFQSVHIIICI